MLKSFSLTTVFIFGLLVLYNQKKTIQDSLKNLDDKNFEILDKYLKDRTVVGIGEYTHGDGKLFELKTEIIKYLHEELEFEAILMESDFLSVENTLTALSTHSYKDASNIGIQSTWADSQEYLSLIKYLEITTKKGDTLYFHGFDSQMTGKNSINIHKARAKLLKTKIPINDYNHLMSSLELIRTKDISNVPMDSLKALKTSVSHILKVVNNISDKTYQWLKNTDGNLKGLIYLKEAPAVTPKNMPEIFSHPNYLKNSSIRDSLMSENIEFYLKKYKKVIIWAANKHLQHKSNDRTWMGELLKKSLKDNYYSILVLYDHGVWSYPQGKPSGTIPKSVDGTLSFKIANATNNKVSFLDVTNTIIPKMKVRTNNWMTTDSINISNYCDAVLFVRKATGSTMINE